MFDMTTDGEVFGSTTPGRSDDLRREALRKSERLARALQTPVSFLNETLPAYARRQRLTAMLAEVSAAESSRLAGLTDAITLLNRAVGLRERLERALERAGGPLSATESAEQASGVGRDTPNRLGPDLGVFRNPEVYDYPLSEVIKSRLRSGALRDGLSKPGPY